MTAALVADYVIVGAGSAGCLLADRLSADGATVLLLEAGCDDRPSHNLKHASTIFNLHVPVGWTTVLSDPLVNWGYTSEAIDGIKGRSLPFPRGRVLGGSSSINGLIYVRGLSEDYDGWRQRGATGWAWADVEPVFRRSLLRANGSGVAMSIEPVPMREPVGDAVIEACHEAGVPRGADLNGKQQEGVCYSPQTLRKGRRMSASVAFLHPAMRRSNLKVETDILVTRVTFEGRRATGVEFSRGGELSVATARREVILAAGAINSPKILQLSGVGPADLLRKHGVAVIVDSPQVGQNMQDHYAVSLRARLKPGTPSLNQLSYGLGLAGQVARWLTRQDGLLTVGGAQVTGYVRTRPELDLPDAQLFSSTATVDYAATVATGKVTMERQPGLTIGGYTMRPQSRGYVNIQSADPATHPVMNPNYLADTADQAAAVSLFNFERKVLNQPALARFVERELAPGAELTDDAELLDYLRGEGTTPFHYSGTVAMGGEGAPLDPRLCVRGVSGLRVVDASVMPSISSGNTNAPVYMIAQKAAEMILEDAKSLAAAAA
jgi:choline dehydrogenase